MFCVLLGYSCVGIFGYLRGIFGVFGVVWGLSCVVVTFLALWVGFGWFWRYFGAFEYLGFVVLLSFGCLKLVLGWLFGFWIVRFECVLGLESRADFWFALIV